MRLDRYKFQEQYGGGPRRESINRNEFRSFLLHARLMLAHNATKCTPHCNNRFYAKTFFRKNSFNLLFFMSKI